MLTKAVSSYFSAIKILPRRFNRGSLCCAAASSVIWKLSLLEPFATKFKIVSPFQGPFSTACRQIFLRDLFLRNTTG